MNRIAIIAPSARPPTADPIATGVATFELDWILAQDWKMPHGIPYLVSRERHSVEPPPPLCNGPLAQARPVESTRLKQVWDDMGNLLKLIGLRDKEWDACDYTGVNQWNSDQYGGTHQWHCPGNRVLGIRGNVEWWVESGATCFTQSMQTINMTLYNGPSSYMGVCRSLVSRSSLCTDVYMLDRLKAFNIVNVTWSIHPYCESGPLITVPVRREK